MTNPNKPTSSKWRPLVTWILASAIAVSVAVFVGSPTAYAVGDLTLGDTPTEEEAALRGLCCHPASFLATFCTTVALVQWGVLRENYKTGVAEFVGSFLVVLLVTAATMPIVRRLWFLAAMGTAWWGGMREVGRFLVMAVMTGGASGAITGMIVIRKTGLTEGERDRENDQSIGGKSE